MSYSTAKDVLHVEIKKHGLKRAATGKQGAPLFKKLQYAAGRFVDSRSIAYKNDSLSGIPFTEDFGQHTDITKSLFP